MNTRTTVAGAVAGLLLLAGCSSSEPSASPSSTAASASSDDATRAMYQCVTFRWSSGVVDSEEAARESCDEAREHDGGAFVDEWLERYEEQYRFSDPALE